MSWVVLFISLLIFNVISSLVVFRSQKLSAGSSSLQYAVIWLIPFLGAFSIIIFAAYIAKEPLGNGDAFDPLHIPSGGSHLTGGFYADGADSSGGDGGDSD